MTTPLKPLLLTSLCLIACSKGTEQPTSDSSLSELTMDGRLYRIQSEIRDNACGDWGPSFNDSIHDYELRITFPDLETARLHWTYPQDCPREDATVTCETEEALPLYDFAPDSDALIVYEDRLELTWYESDRATGTWQVDLDCTGTQCELIGELNEQIYPCSILMDWSLEPAEVLSND